MWHAHPLDAFLRRPLARLHGSKKDHCRIYKRDDVLSHIISAAGTSSNYLVVHQQCKHALHETSDHHDHLGVHAINASITMLARQRTAEQPVLPSRAEDSQPIASSPSAKLAVWVVHVTTALDASYPQAPGPFAGLLHDRRLTTNIIPCHSMFVQEAFPPHLDGLIQLQEKQGWENEPRPHSPAFSALQFALDVEPV